MLLQLLTALASSIMLLQLLTALASSIMLLQLLTALASSIMLLQLLTALACQCRRNTNPKHILTPPPPPSEHVNYLQIPSQLIGDPLPSPNTITTGEHVLQNTILILVEERYFIIIICAQEASQFSSNKYQDC